MKTPTAALNFNTYNSANSSKKQSPLGQKRGTSMFESQTNQLGIMYLAPLCGSLKIIVWSLCLEALNLFMLLFGTLIWNPCGTWKLWVWNVYSRLTRAIRARHQAYSADALCEPHDQEVTETSPKKAHIGAGPSSTQYRDKMKKQLVIQKCRHQPRGVD